MVDTCTGEMLERGAVEAWRGLWPGQGEPAKVELLKSNDTKKRAICRLLGVGLQGAPVIAKRCRMATVLIERTIYEQILPQLPVTALHYYGFAEEDDTFGWLFLEDAGREKFSPLIEEHRVLVAQWLGRMHTSAVQVPTTVSFPDRGPDYYVELLRSARLAILRNLTNPALGVDDRTVLNTIVSQCDTLEAGWKRVENCCQRIPSTLVHGDFRRKNVFIRTDDRTGTNLFPIDWETAGWGVPAADLAPSRSRYAGHHLDLPTYLSVVRECWPSVDMPTLQNLVSVGIVFRRLAAINWASMSLASKSAGEAVRSMRHYQVEVAEILNGSWAH
jgi:thiamine kinase-like enzyme